MYIFMVYTECLYRPGSPLGSPLFHRPLQPSPPGSPQPPNCLQSSAFSRMFHIVGITQYIAVHIGFFHLTRCIQGSSVSCHPRPLAHFFLAQNNTPSSGGSSVYLSVTYARASCFFPRLGNYGHSCSKHPCTGFCVDLNLQLLWVNTNEHDCWVLASSLFSGPISPRRAPGQPGCPLRPWAKTILNLHQ